MKTWLLLHYKIPPKPTSSRVYIWRKLKKAGAFLMQDSVWIMPYNIKTLEQFQWLAIEIQELGGEVFVWKSESLLPAQEDSLIDHFNAQVIRIYEEIGLELEQDHPNLSFISQKYQQASMQDYFQCELGKEIRKQLLQKMGDDE
ncbi:MULTISPECIES: Chromate resistance protein ChrB [unclassified Paenibacillus]|uniref:Chromate resistance protein ChrB n=1 Tax=unclassified Paenibacillus TaxID=185978 RepID=UPI001AE18B8D